MSLELTWSIEGEQQLARRLRGIGNEVKDWTPAFRDASDKLKETFQNDVFRTEGGAIQEKWEPLKPRYLAQKVSQGFPSDILIKTGLMKDSFVTEVYKDKAIISNDSPYFKYHQSKEPRSKIPRRIMMKLGNKQKEIVVKVFHTYWYKKVNKKF